MRYPIANILRLLIPVLLLAGCQSQSESNVKQPDVAQTQTPPAPPQKQEMELTGSMAQRAWIRHFTDAVNGATESFAHNDTTGAIRIADSLRLTCESVLDTLGQDDTQAQFLMVCAADLYGRLRLWKSMQGDQQGVRDLTQDYANLVRRMHDKAMAASPDVP